MKKSTISVIVTTYKKDEQFCDCLRSLFKQTTNNFEIIIISRSEALDKIIDKIKKPKKINLKYYFTPNRNLSYCRNLGIKYSSSDIVSFTDDDCLPDKNWLMNIKSQFLEYSSIYAVFGRTLPFEPKKNKGLISPCTFNKATIKFIDEPCRHWEEIGYGNNMAFRKRIFNKIGLFKEWLGNGSPGLSCEDGELAFRMLKKKFKILYSPNVIVYHNKWLNPNSKEWNRQTGYYKTGKLATYFYYSLNGDPIAKQIVMEHIGPIKKRFLYKLRNGIIKLSFGDIINSCKEIKYEIIGIYCGFWFNFCERLKLC